MTRVLAVDTTSNFGSLALLEGGDVLEEVPLYAPEGFSHILFPQIQSLIERHDWKLDSIDCFASASGPGSFTGVRVGLTAVKGLAEATGRAAIAVSNLQALASYGTGPLRGAVLDARRGEVYSAVYDSDLRTAAEEAVMPFPQWLDSLPEGVSMIVSPDFSAFWSNFPLTIPVLEQRNVAAAIGRIAGRRFEAGDFADAAGIDANYVRRSDAELLWRDK